MPKRRVFDPEHLYSMDEPKSVLNEEWEAYEGVSRDYYKLKNMERGSERNRETAIMFTRLAELQIASDRVDFFLENNDKKAEGDTEELSDEFSKGRDAGVVFQLAVSVPLFFHFRVFF